MNCIDKNCPNLEIVEKYESLNRWSIQQTACITKFVEENKQLKDNIQKLIDERPEVWLKNRLDKILDPSKQGDTYPYTTKEKN